MNEDSVTIAGVDVFGVSVCSIASSAQTELADRNARISSAIRGVSKLSPLEKVEAGSFDCNSGLRFFLTQNGQCRGVASVLSHLEMIEPKT